MLAPALPDHLERIRSAEALFVVDVNSWERLGTIGDTARDCAAAKAVIDHHPYKQTITGTSVIQTQASSTSELIFDLIQTLGGPVTRRAADALYTGILTDTGSFRFANTSPVSHTVTAHLLESGVQPARVYDLVYNQNSESRTRLMGQVIADIQFAGDGQVAWLVVTQDMIQSSGALPEDTSGFVDITMTIAGVEIGMIFVETPEKTVRVSLRSRGVKDVNKVAVSLGGGGHRNASGVVFNGSLAEAIPAVTAAAVAAL
jgi:phosphoesterase RecJ-like protein